jgi:molecular chaperone Hsp33
MTNAATDRSADHVLRAITDDDNFRVIVASTTDTVQRALAAQQAGGETARHFADMLTGTVLIRETMSPGHRVQGMLRAGSGEGSLLADSHADGLTRGLVQLPAGVDSFSISGGSVLQMARSMAKGEIHRSLVQPQPGGTVSQALMTYLQESEQIVSVIATATAWDGDEVVHAGGYVIQLLPGAARGPLMIMTERLERMPSTGELLRQFGGSPLKLLDELLYQIPYAQLDNRPVAFGCTCSEQAVLASLASLSRDDIAEIVREQEVIELSCDYCRTDYALPSTQLSGLLESS